MIRAPDIEPFYMVHPGPVAARRIEWAGSRLVEGILGDVGHVFPGGRRPSQLRDP